MDVSYFSERSIEDEIDRESHGNILVAVASYLAMFTYVALLLGEFHYSIKFLVRII